MRLPTLVLKTFMMVLMLSALDGVVWAQDETVERRTGVITGRVVNQNGQAIPNAQVFVFTQRSMSQPRVATTDDSGNFQVADLDPLIYMINPAAPSYIATPREPDLPPPVYRVGDSITLTMVKGGVITGTVTNAGGEPLVQAAVRAQMIRDADGKVPVTSRFPADRRTDDRGIYRIYGLPPGTYLVSAGGRSSISFASGAYDADAPTFAPSSTRDTAVEVVVRSGEEATGIDIRYRGEPGHAISGSILTLGGAETAANVTLYQLVNGRPVINAFSFQPPRMKGFAFYGVTDGEYELVAQSSGGGAVDAGVSEPRRVIVKGANVTGIELAVKSFASIKGQVQLEETTAPECENKRRPVLTETLIIAKRDQKERVVPAFSLSQAVVEPSGEFQVRGLPPGQFSVSARYFAKYWYLKSIRRDSTTPAQRSSDDLARHGIPIKFGDRITGTKVTLALGAASLRGVVSAEKLPADTYVSLVPAEKEDADNVLRFFTVPIDAEGQFAFSNLPPGRYSIFPRATAENEPKTDERLRASDNAGFRTQLRQAVEAAKTVVEFKPCQNLIDYQLPLANTVK